MRVVAIAAHPDDETIFAGGTLAKLASEGDEVIIVCTTRGEGGEVGEPPLCEKERLGEFREREMRCAAKALGGEVLFLDFIDPWIEVGEQGQAIDVPLVDLARAIRDCLERLKPDMVITHGSSGEYGHPQHVFTHQAVREAIAGMKESRPRELLSWMANAGQPEDDRLINRADSADLVIDVAPWLAAKGRALECHQTQHAMIRRHSKKEDVRETLRAVEAFHRWPVAREQEGSPH